ncbi:FUSC family protein [Enterococcus faecalis]|uniref:FUSC family protein n=1 Tax=Enterococcus faecalis TaxID=1351 RepID=UPI003512E8B8
MEQSFFRELLHYQRPKDNPFRLVFAGLVMFSILFLGYINHQLLISSFGSLGIFTFLYYQPLPLKQLMTRLSVVGSYLFLGNLLGMLSTHIAWLIPIVVALVGFGGRFFFEVYDISKPGAFFGVMVTAMGASTSIPLAKRSLRERIYQHPEAPLDSIYYSFVLFFAVYISESLHLQNPYWLVVSCASILQGDNLRAIKQRNIQRIFGTTIGLVISAFLLNLALTTFESIVVITILFVTVEYFIRRNYGLAQFFTTPMALMLSLLVRQQYVITLIQFRFLGIVLGSLLGLAAAWLFTVVVTFYERKYHLNE